MHFTLNRTIGAAFPVVLALCLCAWPPCAQNANAATKVSIDWLNSPLKVTIGDGQSLVADAAVSFTASADIQNVTIVPSVAVAGFMDISPPSFSTVQGGVPCAFTVAFKVPPNTAAGTYRGSLAVMSGAQKLKPTLGVTITAAFGSITVADTTRVITQQTWDLLYYAAPDYSVLQFDPIPPELLSVLPGDVIVSGVTAQTEAGLIRRVDSVAIDGTLMTLECTGAGLADAFDFLSLAIAKTLTPDDAAPGQPPIGGSGPYDFFLSYSGVLHDGDGNPATLDDRITVGGQAKFETEFSFALDVSESALQSTSFTILGGHELSVTLDAQYDLASFTGAVDLWSLQMQPLTVWAGWVPVVLVPKLTLRADLAGAVAAGSQATISQKASLTVGVRYDGAWWEPVGDFSADTSGSTSPAPGCNLKARVGAGLEVLLYGVQTPSLYPDASLRLQSGVIADPWWRLYGGIEAPFALSMDAIDESVPDALFSEIVGEEVLLAQSGTVLPPPDGAIAGIVRDAATGLAIAEVHAAVLLAGVPVAEDVTDTDGRYSMGVSPADGYTVVFSKAGYLSATYAGISVAGESTTYLEPILQIDEPDNPQDTGAIAGTIVNALTGLGVSGITVELREGFNNTTGPVVATTASSTGDDGRYSITNLAPGNYTACASRTEFHNSYFSVVCLANLMIENQDATITPILPPGQTRIVLTWGEFPWDLDSHLTGPLPDGSRFWLYYYYLYHPEEFLAWDYVNLDHDDTTSYGPETVTILQQIDGVYRYCVHDFSNANATPLSPSYALSNSGALVRVYRAEGLVAKFSVPPNRSATIWAVFDLSGDAITPLNIMTYDSDIVDP